MEDAIVGAVLLSAREEDKNSQRERAVGRREAFVECPTQTSRVIGSSFVWYAGVEDGEWWLIRAGGLVERGLALCWRQ